MFGVFHSRLLPPAILVALLCAFPIGANAADRDGDGMSDVWQQVYGIPTGSGTNDLDGDGVSNLVESWFGTNPRLSAFRLLQVTTNNGFVAAQWQTVTGIRYQLERSTNLVNWVQAGSPIVGNGGMIRVTSTGFPAATTAQLFYRLQALPPVDADGDGLNAFEEALLGTSDMAADADNDGFTDLDEFRFDLDPSKDDFASGAVTHIYQYDANGRLVSAQGLVNEIFTYDPEGNLTSLK